MPVAVDPRDVATSSACPPPAVAAPRRATTSKAMPARPLQTISKAPFPPSPPPQAAPPPAQPRPGASIYDISSDEEANPTKARQFEFAQGMGKWFCYSCRFSTPEQSAEVKSARVQCPRCGRVTLMRLAAFVKSLNVVGNIPVPTGGDDWCSGPHAHVVARHRCLAPSNRRRHQAAGAVAPIS